MQISRLITSHHRLPLTPPFVASWDGRPRTHYDLALLQVETDVGITGVSSCGANADIQAHADLFIGHDPLDRERHFQIVENLSLHYGRCWTVDVALWDIVGQVMQQPCWRVLGGRSGDLRVYASTGSLRDAQAMAAQAQRCVDEGFQAMKIRFHSPRWQDDVAAVEAVRAAVGDRLTLMVDCNQAWRMPWDIETPWTFKDALPVARCLEALDVYWMEEPLHRADFEGMRRLREATSVRIAAGEFAREMHDIREFIVRGCVDIIQPDVVYLGGITGLARLAHFARQYGVEVTPHTWGDGIGLLANAQMLAGVSGTLWLEYPYDPPEWSVERRDFMLAAPVTVSDGVLSLPDTPGLGVTLDTEQLAATRID